MWLELSPAEAEILARVLQSAGRERLRQARRARSAGGRKRWEAEAVTIGKIGDRLIQPGEWEAHVEELLDESVEESFPASDPPARSSARVR